MSTMRLPARNRGSCSATGRGNATSQRNRNILTTPLILDGRSYSVAGIAQPGFDFPDPQTEFWVPLVPTEMPTSGVVRVPMIARLADGVSLEAATAEANVIGAQMRRSPPAADSEQQRFTVTRVTDQLVAPVRPALLVLFATVVFVLLIACANVANLLLARSSNREREIAIRAALGGSRRRLARQVLTETLVLAAAGGLAAIVIAYGSIALLKTLSTVNAPGWLSTGTTAILPRVDQVAIDVRVLLFAAGASLATGLLCSLAPLSHLAQVDPMHVIKDATRVGRRRPQLPPSEAHEERAGRRRDRAGDGAAGRRVVCSSAASCCCRACRSGTTRITC